MSKALVNEAAAIGELFERGKASLVDAVLARWECGKRLEQKKQELGHGEWLGWLNSNADVLGFGPWTAQRLIAAYKSNPGLTTHLSDGEALALSRKMWANDRKPRAALAAPVAVEPAEVVDVDHHHGGDDAGGEVCENPRGHTDGVIKCKHKGCTESFEGPLPDGWAGTSWPCGEIQTAWCPDQNAAANATWRQMAGERLTLAELVAILSEAIHEAERGEVSIDNATARQILKELKRRELPADAQAPNFQDDTFEPSDDVEAPAQIVTNILDSIKHTKSVAEAYRKILKSSPFDRESKAQIHSAVNQLTVKWRAVQSTLDKPKKRNG